jgi:hypothetical protein
MMIPPDLARADLVVAETRLHRERAAVVALRDTNRRERRALRRQRRGDTSTT